ncbi:MAG: flagellar hook-associated protein FlgK [Candidatus Zixiibacteriota bacterium]
MSGIFQGLELGKRALLSQQYALSTIGHNIANANTPGYSRQRVHLTATNPLSNTIGQFGTGVQVATVRHVRDVFLTNQYRQGSESSGRWDELQRALSEIENIFLEPSETGFNEVLNEFFGAWHTLSQNPESSAGRAAVREQATLVANAFQQIARGLDDLQRSLDLEVQGRVGKINQIAADLAGLNQEVARQELGGNLANDLRDRRDLLVDELSRYVNASVLEEPNGVTRVFIGSMELVEKSYYTPLEIQYDTVNDLRISKLVWKGTSNELKFEGGELAGLVEARDKLVPEYRAKLDQLVASFVTEINTLHINGAALDGTTGHAFFDPLGLTADTIRLSSDISNDLNMIAASQSGGPGDNANAIAIANLQNSLTMNNGTSTFNEFFAGLVGSIGVRSSEATDAKTNAELVLQQIEFSRQSVQGVSLDEEMANLIRAQHAYDAAARVVNAMDQALETLINDMGVGF